MRVGCRTRLELRGGVTHRHLEPSDQVHTDNAVRQLTQSLPVTSQPTVDYSGETVRGQESTFHTILFGRSTASRSASTMSTSSYKAASALVSRMRLHFDTHHKETLHVGHNHGVWYLTTSFDRHM